MLSRSKLFVSQMAACKPTPAFASLLLARNQSTTNSYSQKRQKAHAQRVLEEEDISLKDYIAIREKNFKVPETSHVPQPYTGPSKETVAQLRRDHLSPAMFLFYKDPIMIVEGKMQFLWDETGKRYLDGFGGLVTVSVGHSHPKIFDTVQDQFKKLQHITNIYLHPNIAEYAKKLTDKLPAGLDVVYFVNSGSEANDLAANLARLYTGNNLLLSLNNGYHGLVGAPTSLTAMSSWKHFDSQGVQHLPSPNPYRGPYKRDDPEAGAKYARDVKEFLSFSTPGKVAAFFAEPIQGGGGALDLPKNYLKHIYPIIREMGGVCVSDEVQTGFGRLGTHFWGFETQDVVPDIVTMAKGMGNGAPLAAVATRREIADQLASRLYFNTFGGNPISCAIGSTVLDIMEEENTQRNALVVGTYLKDKLEELKSKHEIIGDVRGQGLMLGVEMVKTRSGMEPATEEAGEVIEVMKDLGVLIGRGGNNKSVLRIKPPMCFTLEDVDCLVDALDIALLHVK